MEPYIFDFTLHILIPALPWILMLLAFLFGAYLYIKPRINRKRIIYAISAFSVLGLMLLINSMFFRMRVPEFESILEKHTDFFVTMNQNKIYLEDNDKFGGNYGARQTWVYKLLNKNLYVVSKNYDNIKAKLVDNHWEVTAPTSIKNHSKKKIIAGFETIIDRITTFNKDRYNNRIEWKKKGNTELISTIDHKSSKLKNFKITDIELGLKPRRSDAVGLGDMKIRTNQGSFHLPGEYYIKGLDIELLDDDTWQVEVSEVNSYRSLPMVNSTLDKMLDLLLIELEKERKADIEKSQPKGW